MFLYFNYFRSQFLINWDPIFNQPQKILGNYAQNYQNIAEFQNICLVFYWFFIMKKKVKKPLDLEEALA